MINALLKDRHRTWMFVLLCLLLTESTRVSGQCFIQEDLRTWTNVANGAGVWQPNATGTLVNQTSNSAPTFFYSPDTFSNGVLTFTMELYQASDDDWIGFAVGYNGPINGQTANNFYDMVLFTWRWDQPNSGTRGFVLSRLTGPNVNFSNFSGANSTILASDLTGANGTYREWQYNTPYNVRLEYSKTRYRVTINNVEIFNISGNFPTGRMAFYNYSQAGVQYRNVRTYPGVEVVGTAASCGGAQDGEVMACPGSAGQPPFSYMWSNGATSQTVSNLNPGTYQVTLTDANGCTAVDNFTVVSSDVTAPSAQCQNLTVALNASGQASVTAAQIDNGSTDACGIASRSLNTATFTCANVGNNPVTLTVTDPSGNTSTCAATVTVQDNIAPTVACNNLTVTLNASGQGAITVNQVDNNSTDNCGIGNRTLSQSAFTCAHTGSNSVVLTVTDNSGNASTCTASVNVIDNSNPTASCNNLTVGLNASGTANITAAQINNGSTDNCGVANVVIDQASFSCNDLGSNTVALTVTDPSGNSSVCTATVTVNDSIAPTAVCQNLTLQLPASGDTTLAASTLSNSTDNCSINTEVLSQARFTCADIGQNTLTLTVTDVQGNSSTCTATVTVVDNNGVTTRNINLGPDSTFCDGDTVLLDAGAGFNNYVWSNGGSAQVEPINQPGVYAVVATDSLGCQGQDSISLAVHVVADPNGRSRLGPAVICRDDTLELTSDPGYASYAWSTGDNQQNTFVSSGGVYTLTVMDSTGCERVDSVAIQYIDAIDPNPIIDPVGQPLYICAGNTLQLDVRQGYYRYEWSHGDTTQVVTVGPGTYSVTVTNGFGCWEESDPKTVAIAMPVTPVISLNNGQLCSSPATTYQWYLNGVAVIDDTLQCSFSTVPGSYTVITIDSFGCEVESDPFALVSAAEAAAGELRVNAYPNPFRESVRISVELPQADVIRLEVFDLRGKLVDRLFEGAMPGGESRSFEFRAEDNPAGIYFYRIVSKGGLNQSGKLILQR